MISVLFKYCYKRNIESYRDLYKFGQKYAKEGYDMNLLKLL